MSSLKVMLSKDFIFLIWFQLICVDDFGVFWHQLEILYLISTHLKLKAISLMVSLLSQKNKKQNKTNLTNFIQSASKSDQYF